jgi:hypothetical protein
VCPKCGSLTRSFRSACRIPGRYGCPRPGLSTAARYASRLSTHQGRACTPCRSRCLARHLAHMATALMREKCPQAWQYPSLTVHSLAIAATALIVPCLRQCPDAPCFILTIPFTARLFLQVTRDGAFPAGHRLRLYCHLLVFSRDRSRSS